jgi:hypothetical protein
LEDHYKEINVKKFLLMLSAVLFSMLACAATFPSRESARSDEHCKSEWTKRGQLDQRMYDYCMKKEGDGYAEALILMDKYKSQPWIQDVVNFSIKEWTKSGVRQDSMVKFSMAKIIDGWEDMAYESKQPGFNKAKLQLCQNKWGVQFNMVAYCYKQG